MIEGLLGAAAAFALLGHAGLWLAAYHPVVRGRRLGRWDPTPTPDTMRAFLENAIGGAPGSAYLYAGYALEPGHALVVEGTIHPEALYASLTLYDLYLQGVPGASGPTHLSDTALGHQWRVVVAHEDRGFERFLDAANQPTGVIAFRHAPRATAVAPRLQVLTLEEAAARYAAGEPPRRP